MPDAVKVWEYQARMDIRDCAISKTGEYVAVGSADGSLAYLDRAGKLQWQKEVGAPILKVKMSSDGEYIALTTTDSRIHLFDKTGNSLWKMGLKNPITGLSINTTGSSVVMCSENMNTYTLDRSGKVLWGAKMGGAVRDVAIAANGNYVVAGSDDNTVYLLDIGGRLMWSYRTEGPINCVAISDNGDYLIASSTDKRLYFFDRSGSIIWNPRNTDLATAIDMAMAARTIVIAVGNEVQFMTREGGMVKRFPCREKVQDVAISQNGDYAAAVSSDDNVYLFDKAGELIWSHKSAGGLTAVAMSSAGDCVIAGGRDRTLSYFDNNQFFEAFMGQAQKSLETIKAFGTNVMEAEILMQRAASEFARKEYSSAVNYAHGAEKVAIRLKEKCRPDLSILGVTSESFNIDTNTRLNVILMNTGTANAQNLRLEFAGQIAIEGNPKIASLQVGRFITETYGIRPLVPGTLPMKLTVFYCDFDGKEYCTDVVFNIVSGEAGKKVNFGKTQPVIQHGNIQKLVSKVQAAKKEAPARPAVSAAAPGAQKVLAPAPMTAPVPGSYVADARCPICGKGVRKEWPACLYCHTKFRAG